MTFATFYAQSPIVRTPCATTWDKTVISEIRYISYGGFPSPITDVIHIFILHMSVCLCAYNMVCKRPMHFCGDRLFADCAPSVMIVHVLQNYSTTRFFTFYERPNYMHIQGTIRECYVWPTRLTTTTIPFFFGEIIIETSCFYKVVMMVKSWIHKFTRRYGHFDT